jgi:hypothetical protein
MSGHALLLLLLLLLLQAPLRLAQARGSLRRQLVDLVVAAQRRYDVAAGWQ